MQCRVPASLVQMYVVAAALRIALGLSANTDKKRAAKQTWLLNNSPWTLSSNVLKPARNTTTSAVGEPLESQLQTVPISTQLCNTDNGNNVALHLFQLLFP